MAEETGSGAEAVRSRLSLLPARSGLGGVAGFDPVLFAALELVGVLVTHGRQLTDDPRRGMSVEVRAVGDHLGGFVGEEIRYCMCTGEPNGAGKVCSRVGLFREYFQQDEIVAALDLSLQIFATYCLHVFTALLSASPWCAI